MAFLSWIGSNGLPIVQAFAPVVTAAIAFFALKNWQRQDKAKREAEFLDELIEATHSFIAELSRPLTVLQFIKIGIEGHANFLHDQTDNADKEIKATIAYIERRGEEDGKQLMDTLRPAQLLTVRLRSLLAKGQVFSFEGYARCHTAVDTLVAQYDRLEGTAVVVRSANLNWDNPEVLKVLSAVSTIDPDNVHATIRASNIALIEYATETYRKIYG